MLKKIFLLALMVFLVALTSIALAAEGGKSGGMQKQIIKTDKAPAAIGPYSQAVKVGNTVFLCGQIPIDTLTNKMVEGGIEAETQQVFKNIQAMLDALGATPADVVKTTVFIANMDDFPKVNELYGKFFTENYPARSTVAVKTLPKNALIEIETIVVLP